MKPKTSLRSFLAISGSALLGVSSVNATQFWDGGGGDANWNTAENWGGDGLPAFGTTINFGGTNAGGTAVGNTPPAQTTANNDLTAGTVLKGITFTNNGTAGRTQAFTLQGNSITLGSVINDSIITTALGIGATPIQDIISLDIDLGTSGTHRQILLGLNHNLRIDGAISGTSAVGLIASRGLATSTFTNTNNSYLGFTNIAEGGVLEVASLADGGSNSSIGASTNVAGNLRFNSGFNNTTLTTLRHIGDVDSTTNRAFTLYGNTGANATNSAIESSGDGTLSFTNSGAIAFSNAGVPRNFYLGGTNTGNNGFNLAIGNNGAGVTTFTKQGASKWILSGTNTYTGVTTISEGTLQFAKQVSLYNNTPASWTAANIKVASAATLALNVGGAGEFDTGNVTTLLTNLGGLGGAVASGEGLQAGSRIGFDTTNAGGSFTVADAIADSTGDGGGAIGLTKLGSGALVLSNTSTYSGSTTVSAGTLLVTGALSDSPVTVQANGTIGSGGAAGNLGNGLTIAAGGNLDLTGATLGLNSSNILSLSGNLTLANLTFQDILGWDWMAAAPGTYELIDGGFGVDFGSTAYTNADNAYVFGNGNKGYFTSGSLNAVIVPVPEPRAALLGGLGLLALLRRRRA